MGRREAVCSVSEEVPATGAVLVQALSEDLALLGGEDGVQLDRRRSAQIRADRRASAPIRADTDCLIYANRMHINNEMGYRRLASSDLTLDNVEGQTFKVTISKPLPSAPEFRSHLSNS